MKRILIYFVYKINNEIGDELDEIDNELFFQVFQGQNSGHNIKRIKE